MKIYTTALLFFCTALLVAQKMVTKEVGDFSEIKVFDLIEINLIQSNENKIVIKGDHSEDVRIINDDGVLKLRMNLDTRFRGEDTHIEVYFRSMEIIDANEGAQITLNTVLTQPQIELKAQEGGKIVASLDVDQAKMKAVTGGIIEASGLAKYQEISLNAGGVFEGKNLKTQRTKVGILAGGEADINASEKVDAKVTAGGDIYIYGEPEIVNEKRFAGGRVIKM